MMDEANSQQILIRGKIEDYIMLKNKLANTSQRVTLMQDLHVMLQTHETVSSSQVSPCTPVVLYSCSPELL